MPKTKISLGEISVSEKKLTKLLDFIRRDWASKFVDDEGLMREPTNKEILREIQRENENKLRQRYRDWKMAEKADEIDDEDDLLK